MDLLIVIGAAIVAWVAGALWYMVLAEPWMRLSGVQVDNRGRPSSHSARPYLVSGLGLVLVGFMMDYLFNLAQITSLEHGLLTGMGIGGLIIMPWTLITHSHINRPVLLTLIDGGYAIIACSVLGMILGAI